jgi:hypothetical protein
VFPEQSGSICCPVDPPGDREAERGDEDSHLRPIRYGLEVLGVIAKDLRGHYDALLARTADP